MVNKHYVLCCLITLIVVFPARAVDEAPLAWTFRTGSSCNTVALSNDQQSIYVDAGFRGGNVFAISPSGQEQWKFSKSGFRCGAELTVADDGTIYAPGADGKQIYALHPDGSLQWVYPTNGRTSRTATLSPNGTIYVTNDHDRLYALSPEGQLEWTYRNESGPYQSIVGPDGTIFVATLKGKLVALHPDGRERWSVRLSDETVRTPSFILGRLYLSAGDIYVLNPDDGEIVRVIRLDEPVASTVVNGPEGTLFFTTKNQLFATNRFGAIKWTFDLPIGSGSPPLVGEDGTIYLGQSRDRSGSVLAVNPDGSKKWEYNANGRIRASFALADDGMLYTSWDYPNQGILAFKTESQGLAKSEWPKFQGDNQNSGLAIQETFPTPIPSPENKKETNSIEQQIENMYKKINELEAELLELKRLYKDKNP